MSYISQRPVAWTQGNFNQATCQWENQQIWTSGNNDTFESADNQLDVLLVNGDNGVIEATVNVVGVNPDYYGIYGAAVDGDGNFWGSQLGVGRLVFIDRVTLQYKLGPMALSGYGMTVDSAPAFVAGAPGRGRRLPQDRARRRVGASAAACPPSPSTPYAPWSRPPTRAA